MASKTLLHYYKLWLCLDINHIMVDIKNKFYSLANDAKDFTVHENIVTLYKRHWEKQLF